MQITVTHGNNRVEIILDGNDTADLAAAEATALRLLAAAPPAATPTRDDGPAEAFGFGLSADTERLPEE